MLVFKRKQLRQVVYHVQVQHSLHGQNSRDIPGLRKVLTGTNQTHGANQTATFEQVNHLYAVNLLQHALHCEVQCRIQCRVQWNTGSVPMQQLQSTKLCVLRYQVCNTYNKYRYVQICPTAVKYRAVCAVVSNVYYLQQIQIIHVHTNMSNSCKVLSCVCCCNKYN